MTKSIIVVGGGQAGAQAALTLRQVGFDGPVKILGAEPYIPYERPPLSKKFLAGDIDIEHLYMRPAAFYTDKNIEVCPNVRVRKINRSAKSVHLDDGRTLEYSKLILATGARPRKLECPGADLPGIHDLRTINDVNGFRDTLGRDLNLVIVGGGFIGLEVAAVAIKLGCRVTVLETQSLVLNRVTAPEVSEFFADIHRAEGVEIFTSTNVTAFAGDKRVERVICGERSFDADMVIVGIGILPNIEIAASAGLDVENGIVVDELAQTSDPDIYAAGDCTYHPNPLLGGRLRLESVHNALAQGKAAALSAAGKPNPYTEVPWFWSDQFDLKLQMTGISKPGDQVIIRGETAEKRFSACFLRDDVFVACHAVNLAKDFLHSKKLISNRVRPDPRRLGESSIPLKDI